MNELDTLIKKVNILNNISFLKDNKEEKEVEKACIAYLKSLNYKVVAKPIYFKVKNIDDLLFKFYSLLEYNHESTFLNINKDKDKAILTNFIKNRQKNLNITYESTLQDVALLIYSLFKYEDDLGLTVPLGIWVFGSIKYQWVIDKLSFILNSEEELYNDIIVNNMVELDELNTDDIYTGFDFEHLRKIHG